MTVELCACGEILRTCGDPDEGSGCGGRRCFECDPPGSAPCDFK